MSCSLRLSFVASLLTVFGPLGCTRTPLADLQATGSDALVILEDTGATPDAAPLPDSGAMDAATLDSGATSGGDDASEGDDASAGDDAGSLGQDAGSLGRDADAPPADAALADAAAPPVDAGMPPSGIDPSMQGPCTTRVVNEQVRRGRRTTPVAAHIPTGQPATALIVFIPGFQLESRRYSELAERVASHCFVVVRADPPDPLVGVSHVEMAEDVRAVIDWGLASPAVMGSLTANPGIATMGHSLGGKVAVMTAHRDSRVGAVFGLDPVNGGNPLTGFSQSLPDIIPAELMGKTIPMGFAGETTNSQGSFGRPACAPADENYSKFYDAATSATWAAEWTFTGADHMDFLDDRAGCGFICSACPDGTADEAAVQSSLHTLAVAFFRRHFRSDMSMDAFLFGGQLVPGVTVRKRP